MHQKARSSPADIIMLDLEDSVPLDAKTAARQSVVRSLKELDWSDKTVTVRVNATDTPFAYRDLIDVVEAVGPRLDAVVIPKVDHPGDIHFVSRLLDGIEMAGGQPPRALGIEAIIESAAGLCRVERIAAASRRLKTLTFGIADYSASVGARLVSLSGHGEEEALYPGHRWNFEMSRLVMAAKAHQLMAIDAPYGNFKDTAGLERSSSMACALGFDGKWAIHPDQLDTINGVFTPAAEDVKRALDVIDAYEKAQTSGRGAASLNGRMIDQATVRMARQLKEQALWLGLI
jgi:citrate lyase beta subunit